MPIPDNDIGRVPEGGSKLSSTAHQEEISYRKEGDVTATRAYAKRHAKALQQGVDRRREAAVAELTSATPVGPLTHADYMDLIGKDIDGFRKRMREAPIQRRIMSRRLIAKADIANPVSRLQPRSLSFLAPEGSWADFLCGRRGWHGLALNVGGVVVVFLSAYEGVTVALNIAVVDVRAQCSLLFRATSTSAS